MQINKQTFLAGLSCILSVAILTTTIPIAFKGEKEMATIITLNNGDSGSVVRGAINDNFDGVNTELEANTTAIGTLASLNTTEKSNLVGAVNEVQSGKQGVAFGELYLTNYPVTLILTSTEAYLSPFEHVALKYGNNVSLALHNLKIEKAGYYLVTYTFTFSTNSSTGGEYLDVAVMKNGSALSNGQIINKSINEYQTSSCSFVEYFSVNDLIKLGFRKRPIATITLQLYHMYLTVTKID